jgi:hypothetical protein
MTRLASRHKRGYGAAWVTLCKQAKRTYPWVCWLCGEAIDPDARGGQAWSLDHLDPIATHGTRTPTLDRVRPAHLGCNVRRSSTQKRQTRRQSRRWL